MDAARSRRYLAALNIPLWRRRATTTAAPATAPTAVVPAAPGATCPVAPLPDPQPPASSRAAFVAPMVPPAPTPPDMPEPPPWLDDSPPPWFDAEAGPHWLSTHVAVPPNPPSNPVAAMDWDALAVAVAGCRACRLCAGRTNTVFGVGNRQAALMFVGEGPGQEEDQRGEPFVGRAGQLLTRMLAAIGLTREQVFIANVVKCRPPNNRNPQPDEAAACRAYLARQIALVRPRLLVSLGKVSAAALLGAEAPVGSLRGRLHQYRPDDGGPPVPLLVTYHPSYYLRSPAEKAHGWADLQRIVRFLAGDGAAG